MKPLPVLDPKAAGIDVGSEKLHVSIAGDAPLVFGTFTSDLEALRDVLAKSGVRSVAMEATGVYWLYLYEVLEAAQLEVVVVNGRHVRNVRGRKTDMQDCQWLATLHAHGLLRGGFVPPAQPLLLPIIEPDVQAELYRALLENKQVSASYRPISESHAKTYVLHPLGLIMRGAITYLVASAWNYDEARLYALHRFSSVEKLDSAVKIPEGFSLDTAIAKGMADFATRGEAIKLELRCTDDVAAYLSETPLSADQEKEQDGDGWVRITATVNDTWQLRWWLMGQGASLEVCAPIVIRKAIKDELRDAARLYL